MPGMNGRELARKVAGIQPSIRTLLVSGYPAGAAVLKGILEDGGPFLQKPFTVSSLLEKVRETLDAEKPA